MNAILKPRACRWLVCAGCFLAGWLGPPVTGFAYSAPSAERETVRLNLKWFHQFQFAGYYAAREKGFYAEAGLDVLIKEPTDKRLPVETVLAGEAEYGVSAADLLTAYMQGKPIVVLAAILQHSPIVLISRSDRNIRTPADLVGKTVMVGENDFPEIRAMVRREGLNLDSIHFIPHTWRMDEVLEGHVDAGQFYITVQPNDMLLHGIEPAVLKPIDYGVDFYGDCLFTTESEVRNHPKRVAAFREASLRGWEYAMRHPEEIIALILSLPGVRERGLTAERLRYEALQMKILIQPALVELGHMNPGRWQRMADTYVELGLLEGRPSLREFLYNPNPSRDWPRLFYMLAAILAGMLVLSGLGMAWTLQLRRSVKARTRELQSSREYLKTILDSTLDAVFILDESARILDVNQRQAEVFGCPRAEAINRWFDQFSDDEAPYRLSDFQERLAQTLTAGPQSFPWKARHKDGHVFWVEINVSAAQLDGKRRFVVMAQNITDRKLAEQELQISEWAIRSSVNAICISDLDGHVTKINPAFLRLWGYRQESEILGQPGIEMWKFPDMVKLAQKKLQETGSWHGELKGVRRDGSTFDVELSASMLKNSDGQPIAILGVMTDISERKQSEEERRILHEELTQAQKMESVGRLAGGVAHDFNNMLGVIVGHADLALEQVPDGQILREHLREIRQAAQRSSDLTRQLLAFARKQPVAPRRLYLNEVVENSLNMLRRLIGEDLQLIWNPGGSLWAVKMDPLQIDQILVNLCANARDAIQSIGQVIIRTSNVTLHPDEHPARPGFSGGDFVLLAVSDTGCGMSKEQLEHLFEPFYTTKEIGRGTGLGLAMVYGIVKQNDGFIDVQSAEGQGTMVMIYLPRHQGLVSAIPETPAPAPGRTAWRSETILLVEDEPAILNLCKTFLGREGYRILHAGSPLEALAAADAHNGDIHLLITDVVMPDMNGRDLSRQLISRHPNLKTIFMSGYTSNVIASRGVIEDGVHFVQKPFTHRDLVSKVEAVLDAG